MAKLAAVAIDKQYQKPLLYEANLTMWNVSHLGVLSLQGVRVEAAAHGHLVGVVEEVALAHLEGAVEVGALCCQEGVGEEGEVLLLEGVVVAVVAVGPWPCRLVEGVVVAVEVNVLDHLWISAVIALVTMG